MAHAGNDIRKTIAAAILIAAAAVMLALAGGGQSAGAAAPPNVETGTLVNLGPRPCTLESDDPYEKAIYEQEGWPGPKYERYPGACERLRFTYGPLAIKPGQNDVLVGPITVEKPNRDGYVTRFKPNLVKEDGTTPPVEQVHLHHGTWLSVPTYGSGPFMASGEEKTTAPYPKGYGMPIKSTDQWQLLYMVHSAVSQPMQTYITYDVDFIPKDKGDQLGIKTAVPVWMDVRPSGYPVFNVQRGFGKNGQCTWPREECARFDPYGDVIAGQGKPGNGKGEDMQLPKKGESFGIIDNFTGGTLIGIGGHLHPGGVQNEIDLVRPGGEDVQVKKAYKVRSKKATCVKRAKGKSGKKGKCVKKKRKLVTKYRTVTEHKESTRIYTGRARYWDRKDKMKWGGPPTSWDFSMEVQGYPRWAIELKPGDILRSNVTYDTEIAASYEDMGISVGLFAPNDENGKPNADGLNPFQAKKDDSPECKSGGLKKGYLCEYGIVTHGHYKENGNHSGPDGTWSAVAGPETDQVGIANFLYTPGDLSTKGSTGIPRVKLGSDLKFYNADGSAIYHTITTCKFPCLGQTGAAFPIPDGETNKSRKLDLDSSELGYGAPAIGPAKQRLDWSTPITEKEGYSDGEVVTYFCRIHPFMRGAFEVKK